jgi:hypothetical protein
LTNAAHLFIAYVCRRVRNRQSAALSRQRHKDYLNMLEKKNQDLLLENKRLRESAEPSKDKDERIKELEDIIVSFIHHNHEVEKLMLASDMADEFRERMRDSPVALMLQRAEANAGDEEGEEEGEEKEEDDEEEEEEREDHEADDDDDAITDDDFERVTLDSLCEPSSQEEEEEGEEEHSAEEQEV